MSDLDAVLARALRMGDEGDWEGMAHSLAEALESDPDDAYLLCWLGVAERQLGNDGAAYERFKQALAQQPEDPRLLAMAGSGLAAFDDPEAEGVLRTAAMLAPELAITRWSYGAYLSREGFFDLALEELTAARDLDPDDPASWVELGVALALRGALDQAVDAFEEAVRRDPDDGWVRILLGLALLESGRTEEAAGELSLGARALPFDTEAQVLAALAASAAGWDDLAAEMLERGRQTATGRDVGAVDEAEERILEAPERAEAFLMESVAPGAFRERLMVRP